MRKFTEIPTVQEREKRKNPIRVSFFPRTDSVKLGLVASRRKAITPPQVSG